MKKEPVIDFDSAQTLASWAQVLRDILASNKEKLSYHDAFWMEQCIDDLWRLCDRIPSVAAVEYLVESTKALRRERGLGMNE